MQNHVSLKVEGNFILHSNEENYKTKIHYYYYQWFLVSIYSNSTNSDISNVFRKGIKQSSTVSRTPSVDSKSVQTDNTVREKIIIASPNRKSSALVSQAITPCVDGKFR